MANSRVLWADLSGNRAGLQNYRVEISGVPRGDVRALCFDWTNFISDTEVCDHRLYLPRAEASETEVAQWPTPRKTAGHDLRRTGAARRIHRARRVAH
ncbi:hypothetical protein [Actinocrispum sp. NPDC049592]|uniref:hypothetical protein n=1 Tax=Actinocrispum sp. NPDC049592 TaxID=3154835 RepID=UPI00343A8C36